MTLEPQSPVAMASFLVASILAIFKDFTCFNRLGRGNDCKRAEEMVGPMGFYGKTSFLMATVPVKVNSDHPREQI